MKFFSAKASSQRRRQTETLDDSDGDSAPPTAQKKTSVKQGVGGSNDCTNVTAPRAGAPQLLKKGVGGSKRGSTVKSVDSSADEATGLEPDLWPKVYCLDIDYLLVAEAALR